MIERSVCMIASMTRTAAATTEIIVQKLSVETAVPKQLE
jgi:hypothetical protein